MHKVKLVSKLLAGISAAILVYACSNSIATQSTSAPAKTSSNEERHLVEQHPAIQRPKEDWVFRSVLDSTIRMLSIGLNNKLWVAYNTPNGAFYKAWQGGVSLGGAVYGRRGSAPQPVTQGITFMREPNENPWRIISEGKEVTPEVSYRGHTIMNNQVSLHYELSFNGNKIKVDEQPEFYDLPNERVGLQRIFKTSDVPVNAQVGLRINLNSIVSTEDYQTDGKLVVSRETSNEISGKQFKAIAGVLMLKSNDKTNLSVGFTAKPAVVKKEEKKSEDEMITTMMADHGCATCHNPTQTAVGPSLRAIAQRYRNTPENRAMLIAKVIKGGAGNWGAVPMIPHSEMAENDVAMLVDYIQKQDRAQEIEIAKILPESKYPFVFTKAISRPESKTATPGIAVNVYQLDYELYGFPQITSKLEPQESGFVNILSAGNDDFEKNFKNFSRNFAIQATGFLNIKEDMHVQFRLASNDGTRIYIDGKMIVETIGNMAAVKESDIVLKAGSHPFLYEYYKRGGERRMSLQWRPFGSGEYTIVPPEIFTFNTADIRKTKPSITTSIVTIPRATTPGDGMEPTAAHPSFTVAQARPDNFHPRVAGMDFLPDGRLVVSTWDSLGAVYILDGVQGNNPEGIKVKKIASGFAEPLGLKVVDNEIYVLQKQELTRLIDLNHDDIIDEYQTVCNAWSTTDNHHEFAFGLIYKDGYFYGTLSVAIKGGGPSAPNQVPDRGRAFKISKKDGSITYIANGLRTPNGIGFGVDNEIFIADNQGDWLPANKIVHLQQGAFYGNRSVIDFEGKANLTETLPVVYLEHDQVGNSPSQPAPLNIGPYQNQMIHGDVTHGGIKRVYAEKINGSYQGAVFRFMQGLEAGINRMVWGPDGALYVGGIGNGGNWGQNRKLWYGLQRITFNNKPAFEMLAVRAKSNGVEIEFTEPLKEGTGNKISDYSIGQWWYKPTANYGGPDLDKEELEVKRITVSSDRRKVTLELPGMKKEHVLYIRLNKESMVNAQDEKLWSTEAWYTMNNIPLPK
jgi:cytochrome c